jgi:hypothetical protein
MKYCQGIGSFAPKILARYLWPTAQPIYNRFTDGRRGGLGITFGSPNAQAGGKDARM